LTGLLWENQIIPRDWTGRQTNAKSRAFNTFSVNTREKQESQVGGNREKPSGPFGIPGRPTDGRHPRARCNELLQFMAKRL
jgi:hypothetical protein